MVSEGGDRACLWLWWVDGRREGGMAEQQLSYHTSTALASSSLALECGSSKDTCLSSPPMVDPRTCEVDYTWGLGTQKKVDIFDEGGLYGT